MWQITPRSYKTCELRSSVTVNNKPWVDSIHPWLIINIICIDFFRGQSSSSPLHNFFPHPHYFSNDPSLNSLPPLIHVKPDDRKAQNERRKLLFALRPILGEHTLDTDEKRINVPCIQTYRWKEKPAVLMLPRFQGSLQRTKTLIFKKELGLLSELYFFLQRRQYLLFFQFRQPCNLCRADRTSVNPRKVQLEFSIK